VSYRTADAVMDVPATEKSPGGFRMVTRGWWECDSGCGSKFWPRPRVPENSPAASIIEDMPNIMARLRVAEARAAKLEAAGLKLAAAVQEASGYKEPYCQEEIGNAIVEWEMDLAAARAALEPGAEPGRE
jgi:hypothetical protein